MRRVYRSKAAENAQLRKTIQAHQFESGEALNIGDVMQASDLVNSQPGQLRTSGNNIDSR